MEYTRSQQIPLNAEFPYASYEDATKGVYETRRGRFDHVSTRQTIYFQWENLVGAKVGVTKFKAEEADNACLNYYRWVTKVNNPEWTKLEGTPYAAKITHSPNRREWGKGRLRFHRKDVETGELWMLSVPEWINKADFIGNLVGQPLSTLRMEYPVIFWTRQPGQEKVGIIPYVGKYDRDF